MLSNRPILSLFVALALVCIIAGLFGLALSYSIRETPFLQSNQGLTRVAIGGDSVFVQVADTPASRSKGLSGTDSLPSNRGILFVFERDGFYSFWMKDMKYAIDIVWLSETGVIVHIEKNVTPESYPKLYTTPIPARSVLELPSGFIENHSVRLGEKVTIFS